MLGQTAEHNDMFILRLSKYRSAMIASIYSSPLFLYYVYSDIGWHQPESTVSC